MSEHEGIAEMHEYLERHSGEPWLSGLANFAERFGLDEDEAIEIWEEWLDDEPRT